MMLITRVAGVSFARLAGALSVASVLLSVGCDSDSQPDEGAALAAGGGGGAAGESGHGGAPAGGDGEDAAGSGGAAAHGGATQGGSTSGGSSKAGSAASGSGGNGSAARGGAGKGGSAADGGAGTSSAGNGGASGGAAGNGNAGGGAGASGTGTAGAEAGASGTGEAGSGAGAGGASGTGSATAGGGAGSSGTGEAGTGAGGTGSSGTAAANGGNGAAGTGGAAGSAAPAESDLTFLSATDRNADGIALSEDRLSGEWLGLGTFGVRSTRSIAPQQGVFYFEVTAPLDYFDLGVATAAAPLDRPAGSTAAGFSVNTQGRYAVNQSVSDFTPQSDTYGFVVDYRGAHPSVYVVNGTTGPGSVILSQTLDYIDQPLFIHLSGQRRIAGMQVTINAGNDTTNRPFTFDPTAALSGANLEAVASALVTGWGASHAGAPNTAPALNLPAPSATSIALGSSLTLNASASDAEDGSLDANIDWQVLSEGNGPERVRGTGASFTFTPRAIGRHPIQVSVKDAGGKLAQQTVTIEATGALQQFTEVRLTLEPGLSGAGIQLSSNGLQARWTVDQKNGVRANQGLYGGFWYVEGHRLVPETNQAIGLVIGNVSLDPYHFDVTPPSCSVNTVGPGVYRDLISISQYDTPETEYYGFAVDYRGSTPIVYVIMNGKLTDTLQLTDATVPIYPMLYGNITNQNAPYDMEINFGATKFHEDPIAVLNEAGISTSGLRLCWGEQNQSCNN